MFGVNRLGTLEGYLYERFILLDEVARSETGALKDPRGVLPGYQYAALTIINHEKRIFPASSRYQNGDYTSTAGTEHCEVELLEMSESFSKNLQPNSEVYLYTAYMPCENCSKFIIDWLKKRPGVRMFLAYRAPYYRSDEAFCSAMLNAAAPTQLTLGKVEFTEAEPGQPKKMRRIQWTNLPQ